MRLGLPGWMRSVSVYTYLDEVLGLRGTAGTFKWVQGKSPGHAREYGCVSVHLLAMRGWIEARLEHSNRVQGTSPGRMLYVYCVQKDHQAVVMSRHRLLRMPHHRRPGVNSMNIPISTLKACRHGASSPPCSPGSHGTCARQFESLKSHITRQTYFFTIRSIESKPFSSTSILGP